MANEVFLGAEAGQSPGVWVERLWPHSRWKHVVNSSVLMSLEPPSHSPSPDQPGKTSENLVKQVICLKHKHLLVGYRKACWADLFGVCKHRLHVSEGHGSRVVPLTLAVFIFAGLKHILNFCRVGKVSLPPLACLIESPASSSTLPSPSYSMWNPWNGGWIPWNGGWIPYFWWIDSILFLDGFHGISRWIPYGLSSWNYDSTPILYQFQGGVHMDSTWNKLLIT